MFVTVHSNLVSNYIAVDRFALREARGSYPRNHEFLDTFSNEYFIVYTTIDTTGKEYPGICHKWNVKVDGMPSTANIAKWVTAHELTALRAGYRVELVSAEIKRTRDKNTVRQWHH